MRKTMSDVYNKNYGPTILTAQLQEGIVATDNAKQMMAVT